MNSKIAEKDRGRFRRVSKARILDGHPLKLSIHAILILVLTYVIVTSVITLFFSYFHETQYSLIWWTLLPGALLGFVLLVLERLLGQLKNSMFLRMGKLLTAFLLFFIHIISYLALSSLIVSYPLGQIMERLWGLVGMAAEYSLFSANFFIVLAFLSWLRNVRSGPNRCF